MSLSQEEIDALLQRQGDLERDPQAAGLDDTAQEAMDSFGSIWLQSIGDSLANFTDETFGGRVSNVDVMAVKDLKASLSDESAVLFTPLRPPHKTPLIFVAPTAICAHLACMVSGSSMQDILSNPLKEALGPFWDDVARIWGEKLSNKYGFQVDFDPTQVMLGSEMAAGLDVLLEDTETPLAFVEALIDFPAVLDGVLTGYFGKDVVDSLGPVEATPASAPAKKPAASAGQPRATAASKAETPQGPMLQPVVFEPLVPDTKPAEPSNLDLIFDIKMEIRVELGRTSYKVRDILELCPGYVVELNKLAGEPVDLLVNDKLFARGEVVVIDENFGVRITEILSLKERIESLR